MDAYSKELIIEQRTFIMFVDKYVLLAAMPIKKEIGCMSIMTEVLINHRLADTKILSLQVIA